MTIEQLAKVEAVLAKFVPGGNAVLEWQIQGCLDLPPRIGEALTQKILENLAHRVCAIERVLHGDGA